jgi:hypothetical protein
MREGPEGLALALRQRAEKKRLALGLQGLNENEASESCVSPERYPANLHNTQWLDTSPQQAAELEVSSPEEAGISNASVTKKIPRAVSGIPRAAYGSRRGLMQVRGSNHRRRDSRKMLLGPGSTNTNIDYWNERSRRCLSQQRLGNVSLFGAYRINPFQKYPVEMTPNSQRLLHESGF